MSLRSANTALLFIVLLFAGCDEKEDRAVNVIGSTSVQPFAECLAEEFAHRAPETPVEVQGGGSTAGLQAVATGLADVGMCSRALKPDEAKNFRGILIARDGLAIVVHPSNPVQNLTMEQLRGLFSGRLRNWAEVGGADRPVRAITREEGSGTRESFVKLVMGKEKVARAALTQESNGAVKELVRGDPSAVGYMSLGLVCRELKAVSIDGVAPAHDAVIAGTYRLARPFLFVVRGEPGARAAKFIDFVLSAEGQALLESEGLVRAQ